MKSTSSPVPLILFWFRRDLRLDDNAGLAAALKSSQATGRPVLPLFIYDSDLLGRLENKEDRRVVFIHRTLADLDRELKKSGSALLVKHGKPLEVFRELVREYKIISVYSSHDYEPEAVERDTSIEAFLGTRGIGFHHFKDQVIFEKREVAKDDGKPYTVFTPYSRKWKARLESAGKGEGAGVHPHASLSLVDAFVKWKGHALPTLEMIGFKEVSFDLPGLEVDRKLLRNYETTRNLPAERGTSRLGVHLRFGTISPRKLVEIARKSSETWLNELIWREFFMQILWNFPHVAHGAFRPEYDRMAWRNNQKDFTAWCEGRTGVPIVDAGMRELNATGFMHNRVRMIAASFLVKHLLIDWRWGERYFASQLLDFEMASNNGNWQWVAGTGCDAAPYFRVFNPSAQQKKFDPREVYIRHWIPELGTRDYPSPLVEHVAARERALEAYRAVKVPSL